MKISYKFDSPSVYEKGRYYFPQDNSKLIKTEEGLKATIQAIFYNGKWFQDTFYICPLEYLELLKYYIINHKEKQG